MLKPLVLLALALGALPAAAESVIATATIRAHTLITPEHVTLSNETVIGALTHPEEAIGLDTRVALYAGRPVRAEDLGPPTLVERNQLIPLAYRKRGLNIQTEGRALERGGAGDVIRVMNAASKTIVYARIAADGTAFVE